MYVLHPCKKFKEKRKGGGAFLKNCVCVVKATHKVYMQPVWLHTVKRSLLIQPHCNMLPVVESGNASAGCFEVFFLN